MAGRWVRVPTAGPRTQPLVPRTRGWSCPPAASHPLAKVAQVLPLPAGPMVATWRDEKNAPEPPGLVSATPWAAGRLPHAPHVSRPQRLPTARAGFPGASQRPPLARRRWGPLLTSASRGPWQGVSGQVAVNAWGNVMGAQSWRPGGWCVRSCRPHCPKHAGAAAPRAPEPACGRYNQTTLRTCLESLSGDSSPGAGWVLPLPPTNILSI